jgi:hypothetical protein
MPLDTVANTGNVKLLFIIKNAQGRWHFSFLHGMLFAGSFKALECNERRTHATDMRAESYQFSATRDFWERAREHDRSLFHEVMR